MINGQDVKKEKKNGILRWNKSKIISVSWQRLLELVLLLNLVLCFRKKP
jgi:hypothetical protein